MDFAEGFGVSDKKLFAVRDQVIARAKEYQARGLSDSFFKRQTIKFKSLFTNSAKTDQEIMDEIYIDAYATCYLAIQEAMKDKKITPYDVQIEAALVMKDKNIAEMKTGEGKTIAGLMPIYLKALCGKGVHVMTSNEYLSQRDYEESKKTFELLGLTSGLLPKKDKKDDNNIAQKQRAYECDITYGEVREFVFDDLRDKTVDKLSDQVSYGRHSYAILDEIDSFLIDESLSPCVLSKTVSGEENKQLIQELDIARSIIEDPEFKTYIIKQEELGTMNVGLKNVRTSNYGCVVYPDNVEITDKGSDIIYKKIKQLSPQLPPNLSGVNDIIYWVDLVKLLLKSKHILKKGVHYEITEQEKNGKKEKKISLYSLSTGRLSPNKRYSGGEQECLEYLHHLKLSQPGITTASTTYPAFFKQYLEFSGMTGTAKAEASEFLSEYDLGMRQIRERIPGKLKDNGYIIYETEEEKNNAILAMVFAKSVAPGRATLIGTTSSETADKLAQKFEAVFKAKNFSFPMQVLSGTQSRDEAQKIAQAGKPRSITIATNMAGRGTDIKLDERTLKPDPKDPSEAGLMVVLSDFYLDERTHDQFVGRAARKGQPGSAVTILSLEDPIMKYLGIGLSQEHGKKGVPLDEKLTKQIVKELEKYRKIDHGSKQQTRKWNNNCGMIEQEMFQEIYQTRQTLLSEKDLLGRLESLAPRFSEVLETEVEQKGFLHLKTYWDAANVVLPLKEQCKQDPQSLKTELERTYLDSLSTITPEETEQVRKEILKTYDSKWQDMLGGIEFTRKSMTAESGGNNSTAFWSNYIRELDKQVKQFMDDVQTSIVEIVAKKASKAVVNGGKTI